MCYTYNIDEYNSLSISSSFDIGEQTYNLEYQISTQLEKNYNISTTMEVEKRIQNNNYSPIQDVVTEKQKQESSINNWTEAWTKTWNQIGDVLETFNETMQEASKPIVTVVAIVGIVVLIIPGPQPI